MEALCTTRWLSDLSDLNLEFVSSVQDVHVEEIVARFGARLRCLNLNGCQKVSDAGLAAVAKHCGARFAGWLARRRATKKSVGGGEPTRKRFRA